MLACLLAMASTGDPSPARMGPGNSLVAGLRPGDGFPARPGCVSCLRLHWLCGHRLAGRIRACSSRVHRSLGDRLAAGTHLRCCFCLAGPGILLILLVMKMQVRRRPPVFAMAFIFIFGFLRFGVWSHGLVLVQAGGCVLCSDKSCCAQRKQKAQKEQKSNSMHALTPKLDFFHSGVRDGLPRLCARCRQFLAYRRCMDRWPDGRQGLLSGTWPTKAQSRVALRCTALRATMHKISTTGVTENRRRKAHL